MGTLAGENKQLRIFVNSLLKTHGEPVYEALVTLARREGLAGVTALEGIQGYAQNAPLNKHSPWRLAESREVILELIDTPGKLDAFLEKAGPLLADCMVTRERANVKFYGAEARP